MSISIRPILAIYILQSIVKGFSVFFFVLLSVFYSENLIASSDVGYVGSLFIFCLILGALIVTKLLHNLQTNILMRFSAVLSVFAILILIGGVLMSNVAVLVVSYLLMGLATGIAMSGLNAMAANITTPGNRYKSLAKLGMLTDVVRIVFPLFLVWIISPGSYIAGVGFVLLFGLIFLGVSLLLPKLEPIKVKSFIKIDSRLRKNKEFLLVTVIEFLDSFASSQLFVFLPLLFLAKGFTLQNSLLMQAFVFMGYMCGRWYVGLLSSRISGLRAVGVAEIGMIACIVMLLLVNNLEILYLFTFILGAFARGTSPAIKAMSFDTLSESQIKKGAAVHVVSGDSGGALGQFLYGLLIAKFGVEAPFVLSIVVALMVGVICFWAYFRKPNSELSK